MPAAGPAAPRDTLLRVSHPTEEHRWTATAKIVGGRRARRSRPRSSGPSRGRCARSYCPGNPSPASPRDRGRPMAKSKPSKDRPRRRTRSPRRSTPSPRQPASRWQRRTRRRTARGSRSEGGGEARTAAEGQGPAPGEGEGRGGRGARPGEACGGRNGKPAKGRAKRKSSRRPTLLRRGPDGEILAPGDLLLPGGTQRVEEIQYLFRGWAAAEHSSEGEEAIAEVFARRPLRASSPPTATSCRGPSPGPTTASSAGASSP